MLVPGERALEIQAKVSASARDNKKATAISWLLCDNKNKPVSRYSPSATETQAGDVGVCGFVVCACNIPSWIILCS